MVIASKVRLRFAKHGDLRLVSHHDLMRCLERMIRRAGLPIAASQGFNPRPKIVFPLAMGLGIEGCREVVELELTEPLEPVDVLQKLAAVAPEGLDFHDSEAATPGRSSHAVSVCYALPVPESHHSTTVAALEAFLAAKQWPHTRQRPDRTISVDLRSFLLDASLGADGVLRFGLRVDPQGSARPEEIAEALGLRELLDTGAFLVRTDVELDAPENSQENHGSADVARNDRPGRSVEFLKARVRSMHEPDSLPPSADSVSPSVDG